MDPEFAVRLERTPIERVTLIVEALGKIDDYRGRLMEGEAELPYTLPEGASPEEAERFFARTANLVGTIDRASANLLALQTRLEGEIPDIVELYRIAQGVEDAFEAGWLCDPELYSRMQDTLEQRLQEIFTQGRASLVERRAYPVVVEQVTSEPEEESACPEQAPQDPLAHIRVDAQTAEAICEALGVSYQGGKLTLGDGAKFSGDRGRLLNEMLTVGQVNGLTAEAAARMMHDTTDARARNLAKCAINSLKPVLERMGFVLVAEATPNPQPHRRAIATYFLEVEAGTLKALLPDGVKKRINTG